MPKITFGMIVLNGEPYLRYNLRSLYPFAHQIIVVEGASPGAAGIASPSGHSVDNTLEVLQEFKTDEDPDDKVIIITAEDTGLPNGFWPGEKDQQSQAYAEKATGDYLWQVDVDEFYKKDDMRRILQLLGNDPEITAMSFKMITFWGGFDYLVDGWYLRQGADQYHRLFMWRPDYQYQTHRPPTVVDSNGQNLRKKRWMNAGETANLGIVLYHYSLVFPKQVIEKSKYYQDAAWSKRSQAEQWYQESYIGLKRPYRAHNVYQYPSWIARYKGKSHPRQIALLQDDIEQNKIDLKVRQKDDIELLLDSLFYKVGRSILIALTPVHILYRRFREFLSMIKKKLIS